MRIDLVFDSVETGHQDGRVSVVRIAGRVRVAKLEALGVRGFGVGRNADNGASVGGGVTDGNRCLKARDKTLEGVCRRVRDGAQGCSVFQKAAHEPMGGFAQARVAVFVEKYGLSVLPEEHVHVHAVAGFGCNGLRHEGGRLTLADSFVFDDIFCDHGAVRHGADLAEFDFNLELAGAADLVMMVFYGHAHLLHQHTHAASRILGDVVGGGDMVAPLRIDLITLAVLGVAVPFGLDRIHLVGDAV